VDGGINGLKQILGYLSRVKLPLDEFGVDGKIIFKWMCQTVVKVERINWLWVQSNGGFCEQGDGLPCFIKIGVSSPALGCC
jgi:hypothetical protein